MPKCFAHTANNKQRRVLNDILGLNESIILESCDYVFNDEGQKCNSTGTVWKSVEYAKNKNYNTSTYLGQPIVKFNHLFIKIDRKI